MESRSGNAVHFTVYLLLLALVALAPLPFGSVQPLAVVTVQLVAFMLLAAVLATRATGEFWRMPLRSSVPALLLLGVAALQCIPLPYPMVASIAVLPGSARAVAAEFVPHVNASWIPMSLEPAATMDALLRLAAYIAIAVVTMVVVTSRSRLRGALTVLTGAAAFQALYGLVEYLSGSQRILGYEKQYFLDSATGTFVNRNHFAAYLVLLLPLSIALALESDSGRRTVEGWRQNLLALAGSRGIRRMAAIMAAGSIFLAVLLSYSRAGLALALFGCVAMLLVGARSTRAAWAIATLALIPVIWLMWQDMQMPGERMLELGRDVQSEGRRLTVWARAAGLIPEHLIFGTGLGTFESAFDTVRPATVKLRWDHAHNEWLQGLIEIGVVSTALVGLGFWRFWQGNVNWRADSVLARAITLSVVVGGLNALVEFSLRIPSIAMLLAFLVGVWCSPALRRVEHRNAVDWKRPPSEAAIQVVS